MRTDTTNTRGSTHSSGNNYNGPGAAAVDVRTPPGVTARRNKRGYSLRIDFNYDGVRCRETVYQDIARPTRKEVAAAADLRSEIRTSINRGLFRYNNYFPNSPKCAQFGHVDVATTVGDLLREFMGDAERTCEFSTVRCYKSAVSAHLMPNFGDILITDFKPAHIRAWIRSLDISIKRIKNILVVLRGALNIAVNDDLIAHNPVDRVKLQQIVKKKSQREKAEIDPFTPAEREAILLVAANKHPQWENLLRFAFWSGLRISELIALEWSNVDFTAGEIRVESAVVCGRMKGTKTKAGTRTVMMLPEARKALEAQKLFTWLKQHRVFHNPNTGKPWTSDLVVRARWWTNTIKASGVRHRKPSNTRHSYASTMLSGGEQTWWVVEQMGHTTPEMVFKNYAKWIPDETGGYTLEGSW